MILTGLPVFPLTLVCIPDLNQKIWDLIPRADECSKTSDGVIVLQKDDAGSIPAEISHTLQTENPGKKNINGACNLNRNVYPKNTIRK